MLSDLQEGQEEGAFVPIGMRALPRDPVNSNVLADPARVVGPAAWQAVSVSSVYILSYPIRASNPLPEPSALSCSRLAGVWCTRSGVHPVK